MLPRVRQGIQFIQKDDINGDLRVTGDDDAAILLWAAQWIDEHREYIIDSIQLEHPGEEEGDEAIGTMTIIISLTSSSGPDPVRDRPRLGPWTHGVPPMPL
jgi:hypothetical protein